MDMISTSATRVADVLRTLNRYVALACGIALMAAVALILMEVAGRKVPALRVGGADEISGYVMAGLATWGFSYALVERAHVRIDIIYMKLRDPGRGLFDILAMASVAFVAILVSYYAYDVLGKSLARGSRSNTPLAIQLWIPQVIWFAGWVWMTITSTLLLICLVALSLARRWQLVQQVGGVDIETGDIA